MKNISKIIIFLFILACLTTCHNSIMERWWEEDFPERRETPPPDGYYNVIYKADGVEVYSQWVPFGSKVYKPVVTKQFHGLNGWYKEQSLSNLWAFDTDTVTAHITLYATWKPGEYTVSFHTNGSTTATLPNQTITQSISSKVPRPISIARAGHKFDGWYSSPNLNFNDWWDFDSDDVTSDMTLYAKWVPDPTILPTTPPISPDSTPDGMVWIPTGTFIMGDDTVSGARPAHTVTVNGFYMDAYEVPQWKYIQVMGRNPSNSSARNARPVERVSWFDAIEYCNTLSLNEGLTPVYTMTNIVRTPIQGTGNPGIPSITSATVTKNWNANGYRLPTEAEWEYAAKSGGMPPYFIYSGSDDPALVAWYNQTVALSSLSGGTQPVGGKAPNIFGLYDMCGNVSEWCWDWFDSNYYSVSPSINPRGPDSGTERVRRGGAWSNAYSNVRTVVRNSFPPNNNTWVMGFRTVRSYIPGN